MYCIFTVGYTLLILLAVTDFILYIQVNRQIDWKQLFGKSFGEGADEEEEKDEKNGKDGEDNDKEEEDDDEEEEFDGKMYDSSDEDDSSSSSESEDEAFKEGDKVVRKVGSRNSSIWYDGEIISGRLIGAYCLSYGLLCIIQYLTFQSLLRE